MKNGYALRVLNAGPMDGLDRKIASASINSRKHEREETLIFGLVRRDAGVR